MQNNVNAESSSSIQLGPGERKSRVPHISASQPWVQSHGTGGSLQRDGPGAFLLDLQNFPDLSKADINRQNPNIQVGRCSESLFFFTFTKSFVVLISVPVAGGGGDSRAVPPQTSYCAPPPPPPTICPLPSLLKMIDFQSESETNKTAHIRMQLHA